MIPETLESGLQLLAFVLRELGVDEGTVVDLVRTERDRHISDMIDSGKP